MRRCLTTALSAFSCAALALCGLPAAAFAGDNATIAEQQANDAAIQECIDSLDDLDAGEDYVDGQVLVTYSGQDEPQALDLDSDTSVEEALEDAVEDDMITAAQPNYIYQLVDDVSDDDADADTAAADTIDGSISALSTSSATSSTSDKLTAGQYYLDGDNAKTGVRGANVKAAWDLVKTNNSVTVAVIDSGVQATHEDLKDNIDTAHMATVATDGSVTVGSADDELGHGTHVAGIVAASANNSVGIAGASYNATVLPIRVFEGEEATSLQCASAVNYLDGLVESGQLTNLHVMNMSLGTYEKESCDDLLYDAISHMASEHDVVCVCAGGNGVRGKAQTCTCYPADWDVCVSVTSLDAYGRDSRWSDYNANKDISAPGEEILSTYSDDYAIEARGSRDLRVYGKDSSYGYMDGTSMAAPLVSGIFALMWATYPSLSASAAVSTVKSTAAKVTYSMADMFRPGSQRRISSGSAGLIDAAAAVASVQQQAAADGTTAISNPEAVPVTSTAPGVVANLKVKSRKTKTLSVSWDASNGVAGYQINYKKKGASSYKTKLVSNALASSTTISKLKSGKKYQVRVRAWRLDASGAKVNGTWSSIVVVKTK